MSISYSVDTKKGITFEVWDGPVTPAHVLAHFQRISANPDWPRRTPLHLHDSRTATISPSAHEAAVNTMPPFVANDPSRFANMKMAIVGGSAFHQAFPFQRAFKGTPPRVIVFNGLDTACLWLGIDRSTAEEELHRLRAQLRAVTGPQEQPVPHPLPQSPAPPLRPYA